MNDIVNIVTPRALILFNESFAATNEREGSAIARQIMSALLERPNKVVFISHQYDFAHGFYEKHLDPALFLRAERQEDGRRTFKLVVAEPLGTSFGEDVYREVFFARRGRRDRQTSRLAPSRRFSLPRVGAHHGRPSQRQRLAFMPLGRSMFESTSRRRSVSPREA